MEEKEFIARMKKILDNEDITMNSVLCELDEWDSLSAVSYIAMGNSALGKKLRLEQIKNCATIRDLYNLLVRE